MIHFSPEYLMNLTQAQMEDLIHEYCKHQFFLPGQLLIDPAVVPQRIQVMTGEQAFYHLADMEIVGAEIYGDFPRIHLPNVKQAAISERRFVPLDKTYCLYKLWIPFDPSHLSNKTPGKKSTLIRNLS